MKTAITIHIAERVFTIDEDAHARLDTYLQDLRSYFAKDASEEESKEIIADIENRIAEILEERLGESRPAVNMVDVEHIITEMGAVADIAKEDSENATSSEQTSAQQEEGNWKPGRKLYRDPDNKVVGGVCAGLAAYFDVDVTFFRIAALLLLLLNGFGLLVYLVLWIAMPEAETASEKAAMKGKRANITNIEKNVKERLSRGLTEQDRAKARTGLDRFYNMLGQITKGVGRVLLAVLKVLGVVIGFTLAITGFLVIAGATTLFVQIIAGGTAAITLGPVSYMLADPTGLSTAMFISAFVTIVMLGLLLMLIANSIFRKGKGAFAWLTTVVLALFFIGAIVTANLGLNQWPQIEEAYDEYAEDVTAVRTFENLEEFDSIEVSGNVQLSAEYGETTVVELTTDESIIDQFDVEVRNGELQLKRKNWSDFCLFWCFTRNTELRVQMPELAGIEVSGSSDATFTGFPQAERVVLRASGASTIEGAIDATELAIRASGSSEMNIDSVSELIEAEASGASQLHGTFVAESLQLQLSGSSDAALEGVVKQLGIDASGASKISMRDVLVGDAVLELSGSSDAVLNVSETLDVQASGASDVRYYGNPRVTIDTSGASDVTPIGGGELYEAEEPEETCSDEESGCAEDKSEQGTDGTDGETAEVAEESTNEITEEAVSGSTPEESEETL